MIRVECVWSPAARQCISLCLDLQVGTTVAQALQIFKPAFINASANTAQNLATEELLSQVTGQGIWGRKVALTHVLQDGDRLEMYRPLQVDPKLARKQRFKRQGKGRTGLFARRRIGAVAGY